MFDKLPCWCTFIICRIRVFVVVPFGVSKYHKKTLFFLYLKDLETAIEEMNGRTVGAPDRGPPFKIKVHFGTNSSNL